MRESSTRWWRLSALLPLLAALAVLPIILVGAAQPTDPLATQTETDMAMPMMIVAVAALLSLGLTWCIGNVSQRRAEQEQDRLTRALRLVSKCNSVLVHETAEGKLLDAVCNLVVTTGGYLMAWIGVCEDDADKTVRPIAQAGAGDGYLRTIRISWGDNELGQGPTGTAIRTRTPQINRNCQTNPRMAPWRHAQMEHGYRSSIALPLTSGDSLFGALTIYAAAPDAFGIEEVELLEQLSEDLSFGIAMIRSEEARQRAQAEQISVEDRYRVVLDNASDAVIVMDPETHLLYANQQAEQLLGYSAKRILTLNLGDIVPREEIKPAMDAFEHIALRGRMRLELNLLRQDREIVPVEVNAVRLPDGNIYGSCRDITERKRYEAELEYRATHDALTGLANRHLLMDRLEQSIGRARRSNRSVAAMLLDLDQFKVINDSLGHEAGDTVLCKVGEALAASVRPDDTVARLGDDEFMVLMADVTEDEDTAVFARRLLDAFTLPLRVGEQELRVTASLGISIYPQDGRSASDLVKNAGAAMYRAKELGRNSFQFYAPDMNTQMLKRFEMENALRRALVQDELELCYQPKVNLGHGHIAGAEALVRWHHPMAGTILPDDFIPLAEETGYIAQVGEWVIDKVCAQLNAWHAEGLNSITVAVNVSAKQFQHEDLASVVQRALRLHNVDPHCLELELTETAVMASPERAIELLGKLKAIGVRISLDDFGAGYSSLTYLKRFPVNSLKIDQSFVRDITTDPDDATIAKLMIALGHELGHKMIAEGVETEAQLQFLMRHGCDEMQGFLFSRPIPADEFASMMREGRRLSTTDKDMNGARTILLVDDEPSILASLKRLFRQDGYRVLTAASGSDALESLALHPIQVIVSDQRMPDMSGTEFLNRVWQMYPETTRILLTGYTDIASVIEAVNRGAVLKFLTKPWDDDQLREHVREAFDYHDAKRKTGARRLSGASSSPFQSCIAPHALAEAGAWNSLPISESYSEHSN